MTMKEVAKLNHTASNREVENKKIKAEIIKIYKESKRKIWHY